MNKIHLRKVVLTGGGTGGHLYPLLAFCEELQERFPMVDIVFLGSEKGIETRVVPKEGFPLKMLDIEGFVGKPIFSKVKALWKLYRAVRKSYRYLQEIKPDLIVGSGGYVSIPGVISAWLLGVPVLLLEQNAVPGKANRVLGRLANAICVSHQEAKRFFSRQKVYLTGNPVRKSILMGNRRSALKIFSLKEDLFTVFVFGGSSGAHAINIAMTEALKWLLDLKEHIQFLHQTGEQDYEFVRDVYRRFGFYGTVTPFIYQMPEAYAIADLVISRAGASTIAEICATGKPSILIPYPYAASAHQLQNARKLESLGASVVLQQHELEGQRLAELLRDLYHDHNRRKQMRNNALASARTDAAKKAVDIALSILKHTTHLQTGENLSKTARTVNSGVEPAGRLRDV